MFDNNVVAYVSPLLRGAGVPHAFSTRLGGVSGGPFASLNLGNPAGSPQQDDPANIARNYRLLREAVGCPDRRLVFAHQVHGACVIDPADAAVTDTLYGGDELGKADAITSADAALLVSVRTADCVPVLLAAHDGRRVAAVHAGWRGVIAGVVTAALRQFELPADVIAAVGPSIGFDAFEVGPEVADVFDAAFDPDSPTRRSSDGRAHIDLRLAIERQLRSVGVTRIDNTDRCTVAHADEFFSHRRDNGVTGRMAAVIGAR